MNSNSPSSATSVSPLQPVVPNQGFRPLFPSFHQWNGMGVGVGRNVEVGLRFRICLLHVRLVISIQVASTK